MRFNDHKQLEGMHAFLSASKHAWIHYDDAKLATTFATAQAAAMGTRLHAFAAEAIDMGIRMPRNGATLNRYVNDAIGYRMKPEVVLFYSPNCFGTADAISFDKGLLRIHDLKTGTTRVSVEQLEIYAALFCLEYGYKPGEIKMELRIYQNDDVMVHHPEVDAIAHIIDRIELFDKLIERLKED